MCNIIQRGLNSFDFKKIIKKFKVDNLITSGCRHSKVDQTSALVHESRGFLGQRPISSSKKFLNIDFFHNDLYC